MYKEITVCVSEAEGRENVIRAAAQFATKVGASLTGLYVNKHSAYGGYDYGLSPYGMVSVDLNKIAEERDAKLSAEAEQEFQSVVEQFDCESTWLEVSADNHPLRLMKYSDLVITNQVAYDPRQGHSNISFINTLVLALGKPVVLIPKEWNQPDFGNKVVIGWDESREAARAVQDAMPILKNASHVDAVCVNHKEQDDEVVDVSQISTYLSRHDVPNSFHLKLTGDDANTPDKVLRRFAVKTNADLIVVGGYGHTRLREIVLGGVTRDLSKRCNVPVLFSH